MSRICNGRTGWLCLDPAAIQKGEDGNGSSTRLPYLDFLKGVLILLVISFHLVHFEALHPYAKQVVYTFHMPAFLFISGYLVNVAKPAKAFLLTMLWVAIPYAIMESGYIIAASMLPVSDHVPDLTFDVYLYKLLLHPLGPYWYLHTILVCGLLSRCVMLVRCHWLVSVGLLAGCFVSVSLSPLSLSLPCALYDLAGFALRRSTISFARPFLATPVALVLFSVLASFQGNLDKGAIGGIVIVYLSVCSLLWMYCVSGDFLRGFFSYLGTKSLLLYVFSPVFTLASKVMVPYLSFEPTGMLFLVIALTLSVSGSLSLGYLSDLLHLSPYIFGRKVMRT